MLIARRSGYGVIKPSQFRLVAYTQLSLSSSVCQRVLNLSEQRRLICEAKNQKADGAVAFPRSYWHLY